MNRVHTFAGNPLDRADALRRDPDRLAELARAAESRALPLWHLQPLIEAAPGEPSRVAWLPLSRTADAGDGVRWGQPLLLGTHNGAARYAIEIECDDPLDALGYAATHQFVEARNVAASLAPAETGIVAQARSLVHWHKNHGHCSVCGSTSDVLRGGASRRCSNTDCAREHFPRTDPVAIMLVHDGGDRCLLGQPKGPLARTNIFTALAGFIDQGESIEEAVRREVMEEAGISVGEVTYHSSQPWPYASSLMIGCLAVATTFDIDFDPVEMADVRWFDRGDILRAFNETTAPVQMPGPIAIAHHLIRSWSGSD